MTEPQTLTSQQVKENITQLIAQITQIINDPIQFKEQYSSIMNTLIPQLNSTIKGYVKNAKRSILKDIRDIIVSQIDFETLKNQFKTDIKNKTLIVPVKWINIKTKLSKYNIEPFDDDMICDLYSLMDQETVKQYARRQNDVVESLNNIIEQCNEFEEKLGLYRIETVKQMSTNIEVLYQSHLMNARLMLNKQQVPQTMTINGKTIEWKTSQKEFIVGAINNIFDDKH